MKRPDAEMDRAIAHLLATADWDWITRELREFARRRDYGISLSKDPEDYVQDAIDVVRKRGYRWNVWKQPDLLEHLKSVVNGLMHNEARLLENRGQHATLRGGTPVEHARSWTLSPEDLAVMRQLFEACREELVRRFGQKAVEYLAVACLAPEEQAKALGKTLDEIYDLRELVRGYCRKVRARMGIAKGHYYRHPPDPVFQAFGYAIDVRLPKKVQRRPEWIGVVGWIAFALIVLSAVGYDVYRRENHPAPVHRQTPLVIPSDTGGEARPRVRPADHHVAPASRRKIVRCLRKIAPSPPLGGDGGRVGGLHGEALTRVDGAMNTKHTNQITKNTTDVTNRAEAVKAARATWLDLAAEERRLARRIERTVQALAWFAENVLDTRRRGECRRCRMEKKTKMRRALRKTSSPTPLVGKEDAAALHGEANSASTSS
jgi:hypothetical protein